MEKCITLKTLKERYLNRRDRQSSEIMCFVAIEDYPYWRVVNGEEEYYLIKNQCVYYALGRQKYADAVIRNQRILLKKRFYPSVWGEQRLSVKNA